MPKASDRLKLLNELDSLLINLAMFGEDKSKFFTDVLTTYAGLSVSRQLNENITIPKSSSILDLVWSYNDNEFKVVARMSKTSFAYVLALIQDHYVFRCESNHKQAHVWVQLLVTLNRLGCNGNGASLDRNAMFAGIGHGTVCLYTERVFIAILS